MIDFAAIDPVVGGVAAAAVGAFGVYWAAQRQVRGTVESAAAASLWKESENIRKDYRARIKEDRVRIEELNRRMNELEDERSNCRQELAEALEQLAEARKLIRTLKEQYGVR